MSLEISVSKVELAIAVDILTAIADRLYNNGPVDEAYEIDKVIDKLNDMLEGA